MDKLRLRALAVILKKLSKVAELKFATKSELKVYQNPHFVGDTLTFRHRMPLISTVTRWFSRNNHH